MFHMFGTYVMYLDIGRDDDDDYDDGEYSNEDYYKYSTDNPSVGTIKLGKILKNMGNVLPKIVKKSIFSKMKLTSLLMKKRASFPSRIYPVFLRSKLIFRQYLKFHVFSILAIQLTGF